MERYFLILYAVMGVIAFCAYGTDKYRAKHDMWRIPEKTLLLLALLGGALALIQLAAVFWLLGWIGK